MKEEYPEESIFSQEELAELYAAKEEYGLIPLKKRGHCGKGGIVGKGIVAEEIARRTGFVKKDVSKVLMHCEDVLKELILQRRRVTLFGIVTIHPTIGSIIKAWIHCPERKKREGRKFFFKPPKLKMRIVPNDVLQKKVGELEISKEEVREIYFKNKRKAEKHENFNKRS